MGMKILDEVVNMDEAENFINQLYETYEVFSINIYPATQDSSHQGGLLSFFEDMVHSGLYRIICVYR